LCHTGLAQQDKGKRDKKGSQQKVLHELKKGKKDRKNKYGSPPFCGWATGTRVSPLPNL
jgi:hypothetical protein